LLSDSRRRMMKAKAPTLSNEPSRPENRYLDFATGHAYPR
jgi:hypothetical protein